MEQLAKLANLSALNYVPEYVNLSHFMDDLESTLAKYNQELQTNMTDLKILQAANQSIPMRLLNMKEYSPVFDQRTESWHTLSAQDKVAYLEKLLGPVQSEGTWPVVLSAAYTLFFLLGVPGNFMTCLIILMNSYMWASPNYFLFNLAVTDILTLIIGKPSWFYRYKGCKAAMHACFFQ